MAGRSGTTIVSLREQIDSLRAEIAELNQLQQTLEPARKVLGAAPCW